MLMCTLSINMWAVKHAASVESDSPLRARWEMAEAVGVSEDYLSHVFHKVTGMSPQVFREIASREALSY